MQMWVKARRVRVPMTEWTVKKIMPRSRLQEGIEMYHGVDS